MNSSPVRTRSEMRNDLEMTDFFLDNSLRMMKDFMYLDQRFSGVLVYETVLKKGLWMAYFS